MIVVYYKLAFLNKVMKRELPKWIDIAKQHKDLHLRG
jgi:hypothetical protein